MTENDKILCDDCQNTELCKYREKYKQVYNAVTDVSIHGTIDGERHSIQKVADIPWVSVEIRCKYYKSFNVAQQPSLTKSQFNYTLEGHGFGSVINSGEPLKVILCEND